MKDSGRERDQVNSAAPRFDDPLEHGAGST